MHDSWGDGWNGNIFNLYDQNGNLGASCTLDTGTEGTCEFSLGRDLASTGGIEPVIAFFASLYSFFFFMRINDMSLLTYHNKIK